MFKKRLSEILESGKPLVEVHIGLTKGIDLYKVIEELNNLADDLYAEDYLYNKTSGDNDLTIDATPEALKRIFGWKIERVNGVKFNSKTKKFDEVVEGLFIWKEKNKPTKLPDCLTGNVTDIGFSQPGRCDDGQPYN